MNYRLGYLSGKDKTYAVELDFTNVVEKWFRE